MGLVCMVLQGYGCRVCCCLFLLPKKALALICNIKARGGSRNAASPGFVLFVSGHTPPVRLFGSCGVLWCSAGVVGPARYPVGFSGAGMAYPVPRMDLPGFPRRKLLLREQGPCIRRQYNLCRPVRVHSNTVSGVSVNDVVSWPFQNVFPTPSSLDCQGGSRIENHTGLLCFEKCMLRFETGGPFWSFPACAFCGRAATTVFMTF